MFVEVPGSGHPDYERAQRVKARDRYRVRSGQTQAEVDELWPDLSEVAAEGSATPTQATSPGHAYMAGRLTKTIHAAVEAQAAQKPYACECGESWDRKSDLSLHVNRNRVGHKVA